MFSSTQNEPRFFNTRPIIYHGLYEAFDDRGNVSKKGQRKPGVKMSRQWMVLGLVLQLTILVLFYRLFFKERTLIVRRAASSQKLPTLVDHLVSADESESDWKMLHLSRKLTTDIDWTGIARKPAPPAEELHDKWIVITTVNPPTEDVKKLAAVEGWKVVVVGDTKTPADWR